MLKTYSIIPSSFILCLFGLTLITVSPVFGDDQEEFDKCRSMNVGQQGMFKARSNCYRN